ncbi:MAG: TetR/AcrR family transcriptional regulator C-terminal domain-containing protein [Blautia sp.]|nr:TetR/AcrR family transcriptional regulator [Blautia sp.]MDY3999465.1 TetR/AcrR family transcriptional regulator C-terminal domain-containing protein [Blautia sp.]
MSQLTKKALEASLKKLLEKKPLSKITVTDLAAECGINRHTFYYHFRDIYDLVQWIYMTETEYAREQIREKDSWQQGMEWVLKRAIDDKKFVMSVYRSISKETLTGFFVEQVYIFVHDQIEREAADIIVPEEQKEFVAQFFTHGLVGILLNWVDHDMRQEPKEIIEMVGVMMPGECRSILQRFSVKGTDNRRETGNACMQ